MSTLAVRESAAHAKWVSQAAVYEIVDTAGGNVLGMLELAREIMAPPREIPADPKAGAGQPDYGKTNLAPDEKTHDVEVDLPTLLAAIQKKAVP